MYRRMTLFPMFMKLEGRSCLVVGAGTVGEPKISSLIEAGASVRVVALQATAAVAEWAEGGAITWEARDFKTLGPRRRFPGHRSYELSRSERRRFSTKPVSEIFCAMWWMIRNTAISTIPRSCAAEIFSLPSRPTATAPLWHKGSGANSKFSLVRNMANGWRSWAGPGKQLFASKIDPEQRRRLLHELASREAFKKAQCGGIQYRRKQSGENVMTGKVYLVGAGPGDPELLTLKALKLLKSADVVLHDDLIGPEILAFIPSSTEVQNVGKRFGRKNISQPEINALLIQNALLGLQVVRLKSGDPLIFGRAGEEMEALRQAGIEFEIVPGVTAAFGAAANAQIPLTHRQVSSALVLVTGHHAATDEFADWPAKIPTDATVVVYMPGYEYRNTAQQLLRAGVPGTTPCAIISQRHVVQRASSCDDGRESARISAPAFAHITGGRRSGATGQAGGAASAVRVARAIRRSSLRMSSVLSAGQERAE